MSTAAKLVLLTSLLVEIPNSPLFPFSCQFSNHLIFNLTKSMLK